MLTRLRTIIARCAALVGIAAVTVIADEPVTTKSKSLDFRRDVFPILARRCWECHLGGDASAGIRLDVREEWLGETSGRPLVVIGKSGKSRVIEVLEARDPKIVMPAEGERLKPAEIAILRKWIDDGLAWDDVLLPTPKVKSDHWAFQPLARRLGTLARPDARSTQHPMLASDSWIGCCHRRLTANAGRGTGWMSRAGPSRKATRAITLDPSPGVIAITSSMLSTPISRSTNSCGNSWRAMSYSHTRMRT